MARPIVTADQRLAEKRGVKGVRGVHRSLDLGRSWQRINDDAHQYGGPGDGHFIVGDMNRFGVVYMSTAGRGIVYGRPGPI